MPGADRRSYKGVIRLNRLIPPKQTTEPNAPSSTLLTLATVVNWLSHHANSLGKESRSGPVLVHQSSQK
jgi:hypothetical protein